MLATRAVDGNQFGLAVVRLRDNDGAMNDILNANLARAHSVSGPTRGPCGALQRLTVALCILLAASFIGGCGKRKQAPIAKTRQSVDNHPVANDSNPGAGAESRHTVEKPAPLASAATPAAKPFVTFGLPQVASQPYGAAVATAHPLATRAAAKAMFDGGSAVDGLVAASFVLAVVTPHSTGIGGGGFAIVAPADGKPPRAFDFREVGPGAGKREMYLDDKGNYVAKRSQRHGLAVGVPGYVKGLWMVHQRWGNRPWAELVRPAIDIAARGFRVGNALSGAAKAVWSSLDPAARQMLSAGSGKPPEPNAILRQPALAKTLSSIAERGERAFYSGSIAADIIATTRDHGGKLNSEDMRDYRVRESEPLRGSFFGYEALTMPQPSAGGPQLLAMAEMMTKWAAKPNKGGTRATFDQPPVLHRMVEAMRRSFLMRLRYSGDPDVKARRLDDVYPAKVRRKLMAGFDAKKATPSVRLGGPGKLEGHTNTSHVSIIDAGGMAVASTHTVNLLFGSGILAPHTGIMLNNELDDFSYTLKDANAFGLAGSDANMYRPGRRPVSSMTPTIILQRRAKGSKTPGQPILVLGAPGGTRIPTAVFEVAYRHLIDGEPLKQAIDAPRIHHQAFPDRVWVEEHTGVEAKLEALAMFGHQTERRRPWCNVQAVRVVQQAGQPTRIIAASDRRGEGGAMVLSGR